MTLAPERPALAVEVPALTPPPARRTSAADLTGGASISLTITAIRAWGSASDELWRAYETQRQSLTATKCALRHARTDEERTRYEDAIASGTRRLESIQAARAALSLYNG